MEVYSGYRRQALRGVEASLMLKPGPRGWDLYAELVAKAYAAAPISDSGTKPLYDKLAEWLNNVFFKRIQGVTKVEFVDYHPYKSAKEMIGRVQKEKVLLVSTVGAEHPFLDPIANAKFRAFHDWTGHIQRRTAFSFVGELAAFNTHTKMMPREVVPIIFTEVIGQVSCFYASEKTHCPQKAAILRGFDYFNLGVVDGYDIVNKELVKQGAS